MDKHLERALVLIRQSRYELAERELRQSLAEDPGNAMAHAYLGVCLSEREDYARATEEVREAIRLAPDWPTAHYFHAAILSDRNRDDEAEQAVWEAIRLDPEDADYYGLLARIRFGRRDWEGALRAAEQGLEQDAEHVKCNNFRAMALTKLGRTAEAGATIEAVLARNPENALSHANLGWNYLHQRDTAKALEHFREALRLDPEMDYAKAGMVEALKAKNPIYALMLRYFLWMSRLTRGAQWAIILGAYFLFRVLGEVAERRPQLAPWIDPLLIAYFVFALMTWLSQPLFNLLLRLNKYGRYALSADQTRGANLIGALLVPALASLVAWLITDNNFAWLGMIYFGLLLIPASAIFRCAPGWPRTWMIVYTALLASLIPAALLLAPVNLGLTTLALQGFFIGVFLSAIVGNILAAATVRR